jgi:hypothetical protein
MHKTKSAQTQHKTEDQKSYWVFPDFIFQIATILSRKRNPDWFSAEEKNGTINLHA